MSDLGSSFENSEGVETSVQTPAVDSSPVEGSETTINQPTNDQPEKTNDVEQKPPEHQVEGLDKDPRLSTIRDEFVAQWKKDNGDEWVQNRQGGLDLRTDFQDWMYGSNDKWRKGEKPPTLDSRAEAEFRQRFPDDAKKYDEMERVRVYERPDQDPAFSRIQTEVLKRTNTDSDVVQALNSGKGRFNESPADVWNRANNREDFFAYKRFVAEYPEKAKAYADKNPMIKRILEAQAKNNNKEDEITVVQPDDAETMSLGDIQERGADREVDSNIDARDYFKNTAFQKDAETIDPNKAHAWQTARGDGVLVGDDFGQIATAETFDAEEPDEENKTGLLIAEKDKDGGSSSIHIKNELSPEIRGRIVDIVNQVAPRLVGEARHKFIRTLIQLVPSLENQPEAVVTETLTTLTLKLLKDDPQSVEATDIPHIGEAGKEQQEQLARLLRLVSQKIPPDVFSQKLTELQNSLQYIDDAFGKNYPTILSDIQRWALETRQDTKRDYDALRRKEPVSYGLADKITRDFKSQEELEQILRSLPSESMPDVRLAPRARETAELVQLDQVVGGTGIENWTVSTSQGRGVGKIFELSQALKDGSASVAGNNQPIKATEVDGKYFIEGDGRHRTAALKALGVKEIPMLVTHIKKE